MQTESQKLQVQFLQTLSEMMFGNVVLSPVAHSTCGYNDKNYLRNTSTAINLDDHGGLQTKHHMVLHNGKRDACQILRIPFEDWKDLICEKNKVKY